MHHLHENHALGGGSGLAAHSECRGEKFDLDHFANAPTTKQPSNLPVPAVLSVPTTPRPSSSSSLSAPLAAAPLRPRSPPRPSRAGGAGGAFARPQGRAARSCTVCEAAEATSPLICAVRAILGAADGLRDRYLRLRGARHAWERRDALLLRELHTLALHGALYAPAAATTVHASCRRPALAPGCFELSRGP